MLSWKIGAVTVTRLVEIELPVAYNPERPFLAEATPEVLKTIPWLYPDYVTAMPSISARAKPWRCKMGVAACTGPSPICAGSSPDHWLSLIFPSG